MKEIASENMDNWYFKLNKNQITKLTKPLFIFFTSMLKSEIF